MPFSVFISYSSRDIAQARQIARLLEGTGSRVFLAEDTLAAGAELAPAILKAVKECDLFILLWSRHAKASEWVPQEIGLARAHEKPVIPVLLDVGLQPPGFLRGLKYLPLYREPQRAVSWLQREVFDRAQKKQKADGLAWMGVGAVVLWMLGQGKRRKGR